MMRTFALVGSLIALLMYIGFAAQQTGATATGAPLQASVAPVHVPAVGQTATAEPASAEPEPRRFAPLDFLMGPKDVCPIPVKGTPTNAGR
jgi:hypothetical protein